MADESVQMICTSPPYWGLRDYGLEPLVWSGDSECEHRFDGIVHHEHRAQGTHGKSRTTERFYGSDPSRRFNEDHQRHFTTQFCRCGAWKGSLGLEPTVELYVEHLVQIFREIRRVLRSDGTVWLNMGDCYASSPPGNKTKGVSERSTLHGVESDTYRTTLSHSVQTKQNTVAPGLKPKDLVMMPARVALALQADGWWLRSDIVWAKCLSGGVVLYAQTAKGEMPATLKDLVRLDPATVKLWDGEKWNQVIKWGRVAPTEGRRAKSARRRTAKYRGVNVPVEGDIEIELRSGERIGCTRNHKWPTQRGDVRSDGLKVGDVVHWTPLPEPINPIRPSNLPDDDAGWFVGMYLAEGSQSDGTLQFAGHMQETARHETSPNGASANINGPLLVAFVENYIAGRTAKDKHLHPRCWERSNDFLRSLLQGYLEGDGSQRDNGSWRLGYCNNDQLTADLRTLAARLGASIRLRRGISVNTGTGKSHKCWRGDLVMNPANRRNPDGEIVAIRQSRARKFWNVSLAEKPHSFALASGICTKNSNPMPESVTDRPTSSHEYVFLLTKSARYFYDHVAIREAAEYGYREQPADTWNRVGNAQKQPRSVRGATRGANPEVGRNKRSVWTISTQPYPEAHFAVFPTKLVEPCILAGTSKTGACAECGAPWKRVVDVTAVPLRRRRFSGDTLDEAHGPDGRSGQRKRLSTQTTGWRPTCPCDADTLPCLVLDPFCGAGTVGVVALRHGRRFVGIDLNPSYVEMAKNRIDADCPLFNRQMNDAGERHP